MLLAISLSLLLFALNPEAKTIQWTAAGGNPSWSDPSNCDDVVISLQDIPAQVQIGGSPFPVTCNSLTVGGSSSFTQTLSINGAISIGSGGGTLHKNGVISISTSPQAPFSSDGTFKVNGDGFILYSGALTGKGKYTFNTDSVFNLTGSPFKTIEANITAEGTVVLQGNTGSFFGVSNGGSLIIKGTVDARSSLSIDVDSSSSLSIQTLDFKGDTFLLSGNANITDWKSVNGKITISNSLVVAGELTLLGNSTLTLNGNSLDTRSFNKITGRGKIDIHEGTNTFKSVDCTDLLVAGGDSFITGSLKAKSLEVRDGSLDLHEGVASTLVVNRGDFKMDGELEVDQFSWMGGRISGQDSESSKLLANSTTIGTNVTQTLKNIYFETIHFSLDCPGMDCQLAAMYSILNATGRRPPPPPPATTTTTSSTSGPSTSSGQTTGPPTTSATTTGPATSGPATSTSSTTTSTTGPGPQPIPSDSAAQKFNFNPPSPSSRAGGIAITRNDAASFILLGGSKGDARSWIYDLKDSWKPLTSSLPLNGACGALSDDKTVFWIYGGTNAGAPNKKIWKYVISQDNLTDTGFEGTHPSTGTSCTIVGTDFIIFGGECSAQISKFNVASGQWSTVQAASDDAPVTDGASGILVDAAEQYLVWGGSCNSTDDNVVWRFNFTSLRWSKDDVKNPPASLPLPRAYHAYGSNLVARKQQLVIFGGETKAGSLSDFWAYDVVDKVWLKQTPKGVNGLPEARTRANFVYANGRLLLFSGAKSKQQDGFLDDFWELVIEKSCFGYTDCESCSFRDGCGWCSGNADGYKCIPGAGDSTYIIGDCQTPFLSLPPMCPAAFPIWATVLCAVLGALGVALIIFGAVVKYRAKRAHTYERIN